MSPLEGFAVGLRGKATLWSVIVICILLVNAILSYSTLTALRQTDAIIVQNQEVAKGVRNLRISLLKYFASDASDLKTRARLRTDLSQQLLKELDSQINFELRTQLEVVKGAIRELLRIDLMASRDPSRPTDASFRRRVTTTIDDLDQLVERSVQLLAEERRRGQRLYESNLRINIIIFGFSLILLVAGLLHMRKHILFPIQRLIVTTKHVRNGDLSVRSGVLQSDELGEMASTLDHMIEELEHRRSERVQFVNSVAHDLKNPLATIAMSCELALKHQQDAIEAIDRIKNQVSRLRRLIDDLLEAAKEERPAWSLKTEILDLNNILVQTVASLREPSLKRRFELRFLSPRILIQADRDRLMQVATNLLSNAIKYSPPASAISIVVGSTNKTCFFEVYDRGPGIPDEIKSAIFLPYARLESAKKISEGSGLGLAIVKEIVSAHGGTVMVKNRPGGGSVFCVELPCLQKQSETGEIAA